MTKEILTVDECADQVCQEILEDLKSKRMAEIRGCVREAFIRGFSLGAMIISDDSWGRDENTRNEH